MRRKEWQITQERHAGAEDLHEFLTVFMSDEKIVAPIFTANGVIEAELPEAYVSYRTAWEQEANTERSRAKAEAEAASANESISDAAHELPEEVRNQMSQVLEATKPQTGENPAAADDAADSGQ